MPTHTDMARLSFSASSHAKISPQVQSRTSLELKEYIRRFTPAWHALVMGTGAITIVLSIFPFPSASSRGLQIAALTILIFNLILFVVLTSLTIARYVLFPELIRPSLLVHPTQSLFLGCLSMGFATILMGAILVVYDYFELSGREGDFVKVLWVLWWIDVGISVAICFGQLYLMFSRQTHSLSRMTLMWLLPIVTIIVVSGAGVLIARALASSSSSTPDPATLRRIYLTLVVCTSLVSIGLALSICIIVIYLLRLMVHKLPEGTGLFSVFLPLGPLGQAGFTYIALGEIARKVFPLPSSPSSSSTTTSISSASGAGGANGKSATSIAVNDMARNVFTSPYSGEVLYMLGWSVGFVLWAFATCWLVLGFLTFGDVLIVSRISRIVARRKRTERREKVKGMGMDLTDVHTMSMRVDMMDTGDVDGNLKPSSHLPFKVTFWGMIFPNGVYANLTIYLAHTMSSQVLRVWGTICAVFTITLWVYALVRTAVSLRDGSVFEELCVPGSSGASSVSATTTAAPTPTANSPITRSGNGMHKSNGMARTGLSLEERTDTMDTMETVGGNDVGMVSIDIEEVDEHQLATVQRELFRRFSTDLGHRGREETRVQV